MMTPEQREKARLRSLRWRRALGIGPRKPAERPWLALGLSRSLDLQLPQPVAPKGQGPFDQVIARLYWLDNACTIAEYHASGLERAVPPRASLQRSNGSNALQPRGEEAARSPISNMHQLTFPPEEEDDQRQSYANAPQSALAQKAHGLGPAPPLKAAEARSMTSPPYAPATPLEDRHQRGEENPRELVDRFPKGNPYRGDGVSSAPDAPAPQGGGGKERTRLDETTGKTKNAWRETYPTGDGRPSTGDIIRALSRKERAMMKQIADEIGIVMKARWH